MKIKYFAWVKDITKKDFEIIEKNFPQNINQLKKFLSEIYPDLEKHISNDILRFAINQEYVSINYPLSQNDEIAIFPPVSGGSQNDLIEIKRDQIVPENYKTNKSKQNGAELTFLGISRETNEGKKVEKLFYECYEEMAFSEIEKLIYATKEKYNIDYFVVVHRIEEVPPGEISLLIKVRILIYYV